MVALTDAQVRHWLSNLHAPDRLVDPAMRDLLQAHGRPFNGSILAAANEAATLLRDKIEALQPGRDAPREAWRPYLVLLVFDLESRRLRGTAKMLGMSERQVSRERARAVALLRAELEAPSEARSF